MITTSLIMGGLVALGVIILLHKTGMKKLVGYEKTTDVIVSLGLTALFVGTLGGLMTAAIAGIIVSLYLAFYRWTAPTVEKLTFDGLKPRWVTVPA